MDRLIVIDLDETLVDRDAVVREWARETSRLHDQPELSDWLVAFDRHEGRPRDRESFLAGVAAKMGWQEPVEQLLAEWPMSFGSRYRLDQPTIQALRRARESGFRVAVVSNGDRERQQAKIDAMGLDALVDGCVISGEVGVRKPEPNIFEIAATRAGVSLDGTVWVIGDDPFADIGGGHRIGAKTIWVNRAGRPWPADMEEPHARFDNVAEAIDYASTTSH
jgi:HAD superfamily hydrolase (TIGR01509 family)